MTPVTTSDDAAPGVLPRLEAQLRQQEMSAEFARFTLDNDDLATVLDEACRVAALGMGCGMAKVLEYLPDEHAFIVRAGIGWRPGTVGHARLGADLESPAGYAFHTGRPVLSNHLAAETRFRTPALLLEHGVHRAFNVLVQAGTWRYGVLEVDSPDTQDFSPQGASFLLNLAATLAQAIARQRRTAELQDSRLFLQSILEASPDCVKVLAADGTLRFINGRGLEMNEHVAASDVLGRDFAEMWPGPQQDAIRDAIRTALSGTVARIEGFCPTAAGNPRWWELSFAPHHGPSGEPQQVICISRDVTARHAADAELRALNETLERRVEERAQLLHRSEAKRQAYFDASPDILCLLRLTSEDVLVYEDINLATARLFKVDRNDTIGRRPAEVVDEETAASVERHARECLRTGATQRYEVTRTIGGALLNVSVLMIPITLPHDADPIVLLCGMDVTDQRKAEAALRQAQKMEAVGQLTGGLAHDFNNLLTGISGSLELMAARIQQGRADGIDRYIAAAQGAARRAAALTHRLLAFSRQQTLAPVTLDANQVVAGMQEMIARTVGPAVELCTALAPDLWITLCDPSQLDNALLNLCINARDAMPKGGRLTIRTMNVELDAALAAARDLPPGDYVLVSVADTGTGMRPEVAARAFDPFFTTKPLGQGTGLGLSMIYGFARQSGGQVRIHSTEGQGTTVDIYLPRHHGEASSLASSFDPRPLPRAEAGETVLVVDDEPTVRMLLTEVLQELGYAALEADDAASGLKLLRSDRHIDLLVTDVGLPGGMNGRQMADAARVHRPGLKVLFITGYAEGGTVDKDALGPGMEVLVKPFAMDALASRIKGMIAGA